MALEHKANTERFAKGLIELTGLDGHEFTEKFIRVNKIYNIPPEFLYDCFSYKRIGFVDALKLALLTGCNGSIADEDNANIVIQEIINSKDAIIFAHLLGLPWTDLKIDRQQKNKYVDIMKLGLKETLSKFVNETSSVYLRHAKEMMTVRNADKIKESYCEAFADQIYEAFKLTCQKF